MRCAIWGFTLLALMLPVSIHAQPADLPHVADFEELSALAAEGDPASQYALGVLYAEGISVDRDEELAVKWLRAATGSLLPSDAQRGEFFLDLAYAEPYGIQPVDQHGAAWGMNDPIPVHYNLGVQLSQCRDCGNRDFVEAAGRYQKAASAGYAPAQYNLALLYAAGQGVGPDQGKAVRLFRRAASQGAAPAMHALGVALLLGRGCEPDSEEALKWFTQAAGLDHAAALCCVGVLITMKGFSPPIPIFEAAAVLENHAAQHNLGVAYAEGLGVSRDLAQAVHWLREAGAGLLAEDPH
jgi:TPR repeat protein